MFPLLRWLIGDAVGTKNAPAFAKSQENKGERVESIKALRTEISALEQKEVELKSEIATLKEISGNEVSSTRFRSSQR